MWFVILALASTQFSDLPPTHTAYPAVQYLVDHQILKGYDNNEFQPDRALTRAEALKIALLASKRDITKRSTQANFTDIANDNWVYPFVSYAVEQKIVNGYEDNTFRPDQTVSRSEGVKILFKAFQIPLTASKALTFSDVKADDWFFPYAYYLVQHKLWPANPPLFQPTTPLTRGDMAQIAYQLAIQTAAQNIPLIPIWALILLIFLWAITTYESLFFWKKLLPQQKQWQIILSIVTAPLASAIHSIINLMPNITVHEHASSDEDSHLHPMKALLTPRKIGLELYQYLLVKSSFLIKASLVFLVNFLLIHVLIVSYYSYFYKYSFNL